MAQERGELVEASVTSTSDPFHSYAGVSKTEEEEKRSGEDEEEAMKSGADYCENNKSLLWKSKGFTYEFAKSPVRHVAWILLVLRAVERGVYYGYFFLSQGFLTGEYNHDWYPGFSSAKAQAFENATLALNNSLPFIVAFLTDIIIGEYWALLVLLVVFFLPGTLIVTLCAWPYLLGDTFNLPLLRVGMQILYTVGAGGVDTVTDIFGAKQYHPVHHGYLLDNYFVWVMVMAGIGGMMAELVFSMIANIEVTPAFGTMFLCVLVATALFIFGTKRYVIRKRDLKDNIVTVRALMESLFCWKKDNTNDRVIACPPGFDKLKESKGGRIKDDLVTSAYRMLLVFPVAGLFIPLGVAMSQYAALLIPMSYSMHHPKLWTGTNMVFSNSSSSTLVGILAIKCFYPYLNKKNIHLSTCRKVAIGSFFWVLTYLSIAAVDHRIRRVYEETGEEISIGWQYFPYFLAAFGYVFTVPPQDVLAFRIAPSEWKVFGNAVYKFMQYGVSSFIARALDIRCAAWFTPDNGKDNINGIENYTAAETWKFIYVLAAFPAFQTFFCLSPWVDRWYQKVEEYVQAKEEEEEMSRREAEDK